VFVAAELPAGPELVVKVLPGSLSLAVDVRLFEREVILLGDRLRHSTLASPRGAGRAGASVYHARAFVEGTTLRALLVRSGELPLRQAVGILRDALTGLAQAHAARVIHGDLKPENVLLAEGHAVVADTGIVDAVERSLDGCAPGAATTALCASPYVAPERRDGSTSAPGPRDDMYAVGVLTHEMLTGRPPAPESEPLEEVRALPSWLAELVRRCLAPDPAARWADAGAALATLTRSRGNTE
jgi:serine/threonine-protein kinase